MTNSKLTKNQQGNFTIEFAIVGVFFALLLVFSADLVIKLSIKGKLERLSYSIVNIIKERTQLFGEDDYSVSSTEAQEDYTIVINSLKRTMGSFDESKFGFDLEVYQRSNYGTGDELKSAGSWQSSNGIQCESSKPDVEMVFQTSWGRSATFYQVTLCYDSPNWYGSLTGKDFSRITIRSASIGR